MDINQVISRLEQHPTYMTMGAGKLSRQFNCTVDDVYKAKKVVRNKQKYGTEYDPKDVAFNTAKRDSNNNAKILIFDIETSPILAEVWSVRKVFIKPEQIVRDRMIISWAAKWLNEDTIMFDSWRKQNTHHNQFDDFEVVESLWHKLDQADIVVAHNGRAFDVKMVNTRFLYHGLPKPSPYKVVDTLNIAKQNFNFTYNRLAYLLEFLSKDGKMDHEGFSLWQRCLRGEEDAWDIMEEYNKKDVIELEKIYLDIRTWDTMHPSVSIYSKTPDFACTKCGSNSLVYTKDIYTNTRVFKLYKCEDCGGWSRSRVGENKVKALMTQ